jgi:hypothetical protein
MACSGSSRQRLPVRRRRRRRRSLSRRRSPSSVFHLGTALTCVIKGKYKMALLGCSSRCWRWSAPSAWPARGRAGPSLLAAEAGPRRAGGRTAPIDAGAGHGVPEQHFAGKLTDEEQVAPT